MIALREAAAVLDDWCDSADAPPDVGKPEDAKFEESDEKVRWEMKQLAQGLLCRLGDFEARDRLQLPVAGLS